MKKTSLLVLTALLLTAPANAHEMLETSMTTLDISAEAEIKAPPDVGSLSAGVITQSKTAAAAMQDNAKKMTAVFEAVKKAGVNEKDIQTAHVSLEPYSYQETKTEVFHGYQASNTIRITLHLEDLKKSGAVLDSLVGAGTNNLNGPYFSIENPEDLLNKARAEAMQKARKRAEVYAAAEGLRIKRIITISEQTGYQPMARPMMMMKTADRAESASSPIAPGNVNMSVTVNVRYELAP